MNTAIYLPKASALLLGANGECLGYKV
jgi:hypothetical protein